MNLWKGEKMGIFDFLKREDSGYRYLRTGPRNGWEMRSDLYAKCPRCGHFLSLDPTISESCPCGNLYKDNGVGRFGAETGDNSIRIYVKK